MKRIIAIFAAIVCFLAGCNAFPPSESTSDGLRASTIFAMDTVMEMQVYGREELLGQAEDLIRDLEVKFSVTDDSSEIFTVNRDGHGTVSAETAELLSCALALCERTGGALDISIYPIVCAWGFTTGEYRVPEQTEISSLLEGVDFTQVVLDGESVSLDDGMMVDLGSVAKGYTSNRVIELFRGAGVTSALLNLGGNVHALGAKPDGAPWRIGIRDPLGDGYLGALEIVDKAVITSGGYERYFEEDGVTYWHIIDPATGRPAESGLVSVTVVGEDGAVCDGLSTALFVMGLENASDLWKQSDDFNAVFVTADGGIFITEELADSFEPLGGYADTEVVVIYRD